MGVTKVGLCTLPRKGDMVMHEDYIFGILRSTIPIIKTMVGNLAGGSPPEGMLVSFEKFVSYGPIISTL
jgi:hypothetical protein